MRIDILTLHPGLLEGPFSHSIVKRAVDKGLAEIHVHDLREHAINKHGQVDDYPYGGGAGMVMRIEPIHACLDKIKAGGTPDEVIYMSPDGDVLNQPMANELSLKKWIVVLCGHYKGVDQRVRDHLVTREISLGNFVLSGGEIPAAALCDAVIRLLPGVLGDETSALSDSFQDGLIAPPVYTRPPEFQGWKVPDVLLSGNEKAIHDWRLSEAEKITRERRPDML
ncbi:MAG: tRNA (guanosine(37)-N1)-methyltransferase TrmD [Flavobacteriales bacterium]|nr:tRNA (guanosine(37)-N1)-methyltransferase TrmD [Flavobacteriales bacterium]MCB9448190.1 tRNA (guanosine(37)-N1)-methyltransferase TrmD [Flavobacteriales bacterium]